MVKGLPRGSPRVDETTGRIILWYCYAIVHPVSGNPVYVGMTSDPWTRKLAHNYPGRVKDYFCSIGFPDIKPELVILGRFGSKDEALDYELDLMGQFPALVNKVTDRRCPGGLLTDDRGPDSFEVTKPWLSEGVSRSTWFRERRKLKADKSAIAEYAEDRALDVEAAALAWKNEAEEVRERYRRMVREMVD